MNRKLIFFYGTALILVLNSFFFEYSLLLLLVWIYLIFCFTYVKYIYIKNNPKISTFIRRSMYIFPYYIPILGGVLPLNREIFTSNLSSFIVVIIIATMYTLLNFKELKYSLNPEFLSLQLEISNFKPPIFDVFITYYFMVLGAISEELFFRGVIFLSIFRNHPIMGALISTLLFISIHVSTRFGNVFTKKDIIWQLQFSFLSCLICFLTGNVVASIILHVLYNMIHCLKMTLMYSISKRDVLQGE